MIVASVKGFGPGPYEDCKVYENVAQCAGGSASTTGFRDGPPLGDRRADRRHAAPACISRLASSRRSISATAPAAARSVLAAMQDGVLNLCRVKLRDQQRLAHGPLTEYSQYGEGVPFGDATPRAGNDSGGGQPGRILKCKGWRPIPNAYIYFITQAPVWGPICDLIGKPEWKTDPDFATPRARLPRLKPIFATHRRVDHDQDQVRGHGPLQRGRYSGRADPVDEGNRRGEVAARDRHRGRGRSSDARQVSDRRQPDQDVGSISEVKRSPLLGEHTEEILTKVLGYSAREIAEIKTSGAITPPEKPAKAEAA